MLESAGNQERSPTGNDIRQVLYLDVDGVLQYTEGGVWRPRLEAEEFLAWAVRHFKCRWLTTWARPNESLPGKLGIKVPPGIVEVNWNTAAERHPFKAAAIPDHEDWVWLTDELSAVDLADLNRRQQTGRLVLVDPGKPDLLMSQIRQELEDWLTRHANDKWPHRLFSEAGLAEFLIARFKRALAEVQASRLAGGGGGSPEALEGILERYYLRTPSLRTDFRIVEHCRKQAPVINPSLWVSPIPDGSAGYAEYLAVQLRHATALGKYQSFRQDYIIVEIPFDGDAELLRFRPPGLTGANPQGLVCGNAIRMKFQDFGPQVAPCKIALRIGLQGVDGFLNAVSMVVKKFNEQLRAL